VVDINTCPSVCASRPRGAVQDPVFLPRPKRFLCGRYGWIWDGGAYAEGA